MGTENTQLKSQYFATLRSLCPCGLNLILKMVCVHTVSHFFLSLPASQQ